MKQENIFIFSVIILTGFSTLNDSFATPIGQPQPIAFDYLGTWKLGEGLNKGDYFSYRVCHADYDLCKPIQMDFWIEENVNTPESFWLAQYRIIDQDKVTYGHMNLGGKIPELVGYSDSLKEYSKIFKSSIVWLGDFTPANGNFQFISPTWGKIDAIGGGYPISPSEIQTINITAGTFETVLLTWEHVGTSKIWILDGFPFPIKADVKNYTVPEVYTEYQFELLDYKQNVSENPLLKPNLKTNDQNKESPKNQIKNGVKPQNILCDADLQLIFKQDNSPACVKPESIPKLIERGWANSFVTFSQNVKMDAGFPFKFLDTPPKGFEFVCGEVLYGQGVDVWYNNEKFDCKRVKSDFTLANGGISIGFRNYDSDNPDERTALEGIQSRQSGIEDKSYIADINGNPALVIPKCFGCGMINYNMSNGTTISSNYNLPSPNRIQFYDENKIFYNLRSNQSPEILLEIAKALQ